MSIHQTSRLFGRSILSLLFLGTINPGIAYAQVVPDGTLPTNVERLENMRKITGGERVGNNLFHSFEEFSIPTGMEAIFENAIDIENIFSRITGSEISIIDGLLKTAGGANLFLMNPNGIIFWENARLEIGGSFVGTTANSIEFADGTRFLVKDNDPNFSLSIEVPIGLGFLDNNGGITVNGTGNQISNNSPIAPIEFGERPTGISVADDNALALVGNGIDFNGGVVTTEGGNIFLTSVESGSVRISKTENDFSLADDAIIQYQDINLSQRSLIDSSGENIGNISLSGKNIKLDDGSFLLSQNQGSLSSGSINIKSSESLILEGQATNIRSSIRSEAFNKGEGTDINISARDLLIQDGGRIRTNSFGDGTGGDIQINISNSSELFTGNIIATTFASGDGGSIDLSSSEIRLDSAGISASTFGSGNGGSLNVNAETIEMAGSTATDRASIATTSFSSGDVGDLIVNTGKIRVIDGASLSSSSFASGNAGNLTINAHESIEISGRADNSMTSSNPQSIIRSAIQTATPQSRRAFGLPEVPNGNGGDITVKTPVLNIAQEGTISVENQGTGKAGTVQINADIINLDESARITAAAESGLGGKIVLNTEDINISNDSQIFATARGEGNGGNIQINTTNLTAKKNSQVAASASEGDGGNIFIDADSISLKEQDEIAATSTSGNGGNIEINSNLVEIRNGSQISTSAQGFGNGGNITITSDNFALLEEDTGVRANAVRGNGGNIVITAEGFFAVNPDNISATSEFGTDGTVTILTPDDGENRDISSIFKKEPEEPDLRLNNCGPFGRWRWGELDTFYIGSRNNFGRTPEFEYAESDTALSKVRSLSTGEVIQPNQVPINPDPDPVVLVTPKPEEESQIEPLEYPNIPKAEDVTWNPGDPVIRANAMITTKDGRTLLVTVPKPVNKLVCQP